MTPADIKIATLQEAIDITTMVMHGYGPMPQSACRVIVAKLQDRIEEIVDREVYRQAQDAMRPEAMS